MTQEDLDYVAWLTKGRERGWLGIAFCACHEGPDLTEEEEKALDNDELCVLAVRLYEPQEKGNTNG